MSAVIYYFSGTGNSLYSARKLAGLIHADLLPIQDAVSVDEISTEADCVGIVFPVYNHRVPYIVHRFLSRLSGLNERYIFAVCTYGDSPCIALEYLSKLLLKRGISLACGFGVKMPYNYICPSPGISGLFKPFILREVPEEEQRKIFSAADQKLHVIYEAVRSRKNGTIETEYRLLEHTVDLLNLRELIQKPVWLKIAGYSGKTDLPYIESIQLMDSGFYCDANCVRCGTCAEVCPVGNIKIDTGGPVWRHRCEQCFSCLHWCPKSALQYGRGTAGRKRYHHPEVSLDDMMSYRNKTERKSDL